MSRTTIELDDELLAEAMRRSGARTKRAAVDLALRRLLSVPTTEEIMALRGIGWGEEPTG
ncbi:MAG TPA: type II toxin-antitoxin system VapB family antitoxin [Pseudonocardiaceae bacterium]|jgi:Arc/MetJ family transcription regulator